MYKNKKYHETLPRASKMKESSYELTSNDFELMTISELKMIYDNPENLWTKEEVTLAELELIKRLE